MKLFKNNDEAVSSTLAYILFSAIFLIFFIIVLLNANDLLIEGPRDIVVREQYRDIGNMVSTILTDMYLIAPENGHIVTEYKIPAEIGQETYQINADQASSIDEIIEVKSMESDKSVSVMINGIGSSMPINGTAYSSNFIHRISYENDNN